MKYTALCLLLVLCAAPPLHAADAAPGKTLYEQTCAACHGPQGQGNPALAAPALAGQQAAYLQRQLQQFRGGQRGSKPGDSGGAQMVAMAKTLADEAAVLALSTYLASLPTPTVPAGVTGGDAARGSKLYQSRCGACHGGQGEGNPAFNAPRLAALGDAYIKTQIEHYRQGLRGYDGQDRYGKQMKLMAGNIADAELLDVLAHLNSLAGPR